MPEANPLIKSLSEAESLGCDYQGHEFGASYPDSVCIDGYLWDADSCDEPGGGLHTGGDLACPRCNTAEFLADAREEAMDGGCGVAMLTPWVAAMVWEHNVRKALLENPAAARNALEAMEPFETDDWPDRQAVYEHRAAWDNTAPVIVQPSLLALEQTHDHT